VRPPTNWDDSVQHWSFFQLGSPYWTFWFGSSWLALHTGVGVGGPHVHARVGCLYVWLGKRVGSPNCWLVSGSAPLGLGSSTGGAHICMHGWVACSLAGSAVRFAQLRARVRQWTVRLGSSTGGARMCMHVWVACSLAGSAGGFAQLLARVRQWTVRLGSSTGGVRMCMHGWVACTSGWVSGWVRPAAGSCQAVRLVGSAGGFAQLLARVRLYVWLGRGWVRPTAGSWLGQRVGSPSCWLVSGCTSGWVSGWVRPTAGSCQAVRLVGSAGGFAQLLARVRQWTVRLGLQYRRCPHVHARVGCLYVWLGQRVGSPNCWLVSGTGPLGSSTEVLPWAALSGLVCGFCVLDTVHTDSSPLVGGCVWKASC